MSEPLALRKAAPVAPLHQIAEGIRGVSYRPEHLRDRPTNGTATLLRSTNIQSGRLTYNDVQIVPSWLLSDEQLARPQDLAVCMSNGSRALVGKAAAFGDEAASKSLTVGAFCAIFRAKSSVDPRYLHQVFNSHFFKAQVDVVLAGSAINNLNVGQVLQFKVPLPSPEEQRRIADLLSAVDEQIATTESLVDKLSCRRQGFVQHVLMRAATGTAETRLGEIAPMVTSGSRGWGNFYADEGAIFLRIGNLTRRHPNLRLDDIMRVRVPPGGEGARTRLEEGDVLISITADLGIVGCVPAGLGEAYINQHIALARVTDKSMYSRWVAHALASPYGSQQIARLNDGGAKAGLNLPTIRALKVPRISLEQQRDIVAVLDAMDNNIAVEAQAIAKLKMQKLGLLGALMRLHTLSMQGGTA